RTKREATSALTQADWITMAQSHERDQNSRQPSRSNVMNASGCSVTFQSMRMSASETTLTKYVAASARIAQPGLQTATIIPARAGPMIPPLEVEIPLSAFPCCNVSELKS